MKTDGTSAGNKGRAVPILAGTEFSAIVVLLLVLGVFGGAIYAGYHSLQKAYREQMINHDGEVLYAVAQRTIAQSTSNGVQRLQQQGEQLRLLLQLSELEDPPEAAASSAQDDSSDLNPKRGCLGVRLYDAAGKPIIPAPLLLTQPPLDSYTVSQLSAGHQVSRYEPSVAMSDLVPIWPTNQIPLLEVTLPVRAPGKSQLLACAQLLLDSQSLKDRFASLDRRLLAQGWTLFIAGGTFLACALGWGYWRLQKANRLLAERTARLLRANHELTLASKTTALGSVTAHLIHGLCNPLANLHELTAAHKDDQPGEWQEAIAATKRMQQLVQEVVRVLSESKDSECYEVTLEELTKLLLSNVRPLAESFGVQVNVEVEAQGQLASRHANIVLMVLENLVHNAVQATPRGKTVHLAVAQKGEDLVCDVGDQGAGIPEPLLKRLFTPCRSTKGGSGLGLAISQQLAQHLGGKLELKRNGPAGCTFALILPMTKLQNAELGIQNVE